MWQGSFLLVSNSFYIDSITWKHVIILLSAFCAGLFSSKCECSSHKDVAKTLCIKEHLRLEPSDQITLLESCSTYLWFLTYSLPLSIIIVHNFNVRSNFSSKFSIDASSSSKYFLDVYKKRWNKNYTEVVLELVESPQHRLCIASNCTQSKIKVRLIISQQILCIPKNRWVSQTFIVINLWLHSETFPTVSVCWIKHSINNFREFETSQTDILWLSHSSGFWLNEKYCFALKIFQFFSDSIRVYETY